MKYYIIDDELGVVKALENIVTKFVGGEVIGINTNPDVALDEVLMMKPDIILVDYLMAEMDGVTLVEKIKKVLPKIKVVIISKVMDKKMVAHAYDTGVDFFINKPLNMTEIKNVLQKVEESAKMNQIFSNIMGMMQTSDDVANEQQTTTKGLDGIKYLLTMLGINGEKGSADIKRICQNLIESGHDFSGEELDKYSQTIGDTRKNVEQRIRRAVKKALSNAANAGIDDFGSEVFQVYAGYVFDFTCLKAEMNFIEGKNENGGRISLSRFFEGLIYYQQSNS